VPVGSALHSNAEVEPHPAVDPLNAIRLVAAWQKDRTSDGGLSWSPAATIYDPGPVVGTLHAMWHEAHITSGANNAIALASSTECGTTWSAPDGVNAEPTVPALTPTPAALPSGLVGVMYCDFRQTATSSSNRRSLTGSSGTSAVRPARSIRHRNRSMRPAVRNHEADFRRPQFLPDIPSWQPCRPAGAQRDPWHREPSRIQRPNRLGHDC